MFKPVHSSLFWPDSAVGNDTAGAVSVRWLGAAGFEIRYAGHVLLIDPYVTRASLRQCVFGPLVSDLRAVTEYAPRADAIVAGHTHFDHVLDVPSIARVTGARVFGSTSAVHLCRAAHVPEAHLVDVERAAACGPVIEEVGPFRLEFVPSVHSNLLFGRIPFPGDIQDCEDVPVRTEAYRCGAVFGVRIRVGGRTLYHLGSADLVDANIRAEDVDLALVCVAGWTTTADYPERIIRALSPHRVLLSHWDSFLRPLHAPVKEFPRMQLGKLSDRLLRASRDVKVGTLPLLGTTLL